MSEKKPECRKQYHQQYRDANRMKIADYNRQYYQTVRKQKKKDPEPATPTKEQK